MFWLLFRHLFFIHEIRIIGAVFCGWNGAFVDVFVGNMMYLGLNKYFTSNINKSIFMSWIQLSGYPQNQDAIKWLSTIPNNYLHFGDFGIYLNEYKKYLSDRAAYQIPKNIKKDLSNNGNRKRFDNPKLNFKPNNIVETKLSDLIDIINSEKKGLDQEFYIMYWTIGWDFTCF